MSSTSNRIITTRSQRIADRIEVEVRTDDDGVSNRAKVHVFDAHGKWQDLPVEWKRKIGSDDVFEASIPLKNLDGLDTNTLSVTAFEEFPNGTRVWEGDGSFDQSGNHKVEAGARDARIELPKPDPRFPSGIRKETKGVDVASGRVEMDTQIFPMKGYKSAAGLSAVTGVTYRDTQNYFKGAAEIHILLMPVIATRDSRGNVFDQRSPKSVVRKDYVDMNRSNLVTLKRGTDGAYRAEAGQDMALLRVDENFHYDGMAGDMNQFKEVRFALVGPGDNWESNNGKNYALTVQGDVS